jgi:hypothetical protein
MRIQFLALAILIQQLAAQRECPSGIVPENQKARCGAIFTSKRACQALGCCWDNNLINLSCYLVVPSAITTTEERTTTTSVLQL